jgi:hypothetical protein
VIYHYGRWMFDDDDGWVWIPAYEWGPGFVQWRRGREYAGWGSLPPDEVIVEYRERPSIRMTVTGESFVPLPLQLAGHEPVLGIAHQTQSQATQGGTYPPVRGERP